jgi:prepilin-type N-terminal cleavage/methylation domain-containing protein/prepilin-type processing-associated H-X9-DG protein
LRARSAFTLVELLVVIAIIAVLIAILLPSLKKARKQAEAVKCMSNIRSLINSTHLYADANQGRFPTAGLSHGGEDDTERSWVEQLAVDYGKNREILRCPSDQSEHFDVPLPDGRLRKTSYASNSYLALSVGGRDPFNSFERVRRSNTTIFWVEMAERGEFAAADHIHAEDWWFGDPAEIAAEQMAHRRHVGWANYAMVDGHVESLPFNSTYFIAPDGGFPPKFVRNKYDPLIAK